MCARQIGRAELVKPDAIPVVAEARGVEVTDEHQMGSTPSGIPATPIHPGDEVGPTRSELVDAGRQAVSRECGCQRVGSGQLPARRTVSVDEDPSEPDDPLLPDRAERPGEPGCHLYLPEQGGQVLILY
jgi:hypothetical protein